MWRWLILAGGEFNCPLHQPPCFVISWCNLVNALSLRIAGAVVDHGCLWFLSNPVKLCYQESSTAQCQLIQGYLRWSCCGLAGSWSCLCFVCVLVLCIGQSACYGVWNLMISANWVTQPGHGFVTQVDCQIGWSWDKHIQDMLFFWYMKKMFVTYSKLIANKLT